jgi:flagellar protein FliS
LLPDGFSWKELEFSSWLPINTETTTLKKKMFTSVSTRSANAYKAVGVETAVASADPHQLVKLLYDALLQSLGAAKLAMQTNDVQGKGRAICKAVRLIEEGLKAGLNEAQGGQLATNLRGLYDYCTLILTEANLRGDIAKVEEVVTLVKPLAEAWGSIRGEVGVAAKLNPKPGV